MKKILFTILTFLILSSCGLSPNDSYEKESDVSANQGLENAVEKAELFVEDNDAYFFEINDTKYKTEKGYTFWTVRKTNEKTEFETVKTDVCKESGINEAGFGIVFLSQKIDGKDFLLTVMINTKGQYVIGKYMDGTFSKISDWKDCEYLNKGKGVYNRLEVSYKDESFTLKINEQKVSDFTISENVRFWRSKSGYVAVVSPYEEFPSESVRVLFKK